jgi:hypothetical protein
MIIQTAPAGTPRLAVTMYEHNALCLQFAKVFGNDRFACVEPFDLMVYIISNHDAGWLEYDRNPRTDAATGLPYDLIETPPESIITTSRLSPDFNQRHHPYCGLMSSMHSWGLYNGRYGLSKLVLLDKIAAKDRPLADKMLDGELARQQKLKADLARDREAVPFLTESKIFQNYKALQFVDTLALYFNRVHPVQRVGQTFEHVPLSEREDTQVTIKPIGNNTYSLSPFPLETNGAEYGFSGRPITPADGEGGWAAALQALPTRWEIFRLVAG